MKAFPSQCAIKTTALFVLLLLSSEVFGSDFKYDVSGQFGSHGRDGSNATSGSGNDGDDGSDGGHGTDAGSIEVEVGFVEGSEGEKVYVRGRLKQTPESEWQTIDDIYETLSISSLQFLANGGDGGDAGDGGKGGKGKKGSTGSSGNSLKKRGSRGGTGGQGGTGGNGGDGGRGGNGGEVSVVLAEGSELLSPLLFVSAKAGEAGNAGRAGGRGDGGAGGDGGRGHCGYATTTKTYSCGSKGSRGSTGSPGRSGNKGRSGSPGEEGNTTLQALSGIDIASPYRLKIQSMSVTQAIEDNIFEPKEVIFIHELSLSNEGSQTVPSANYSFLFDADQSYRFPKEKLTNGESFTFVFEEPVKVIANDFVGSLLVNLSLDFVRSPLDYAPDYQLQYPVILQSPSNPQLTSSKKEGELRIDVANISSLSYGIEGVSERSLNLKLQPLGEQPALQLKPNETWSVIKDSIEIPLHLIDSESTESISIPVRIPEGIDLGSRHDFLWSLSLDGHSQPIVEMKSTVVFSLDVSQEINYQVNQKQSKVMCTYHGGLFKDHTISKLIITKEAGTSTIKVKYRNPLSWGSSPEYTLDLDDIGFILQAIVEERRLEPEELVRLMTEIIKPLTNYSPWKGTNDDTPFNWSISRCAEK